MKLMHNNTQPQAGETSGNPKKKNWWKGKKKRVAGIVILLLVICGAVSVYASNR